jgi:sulfhydrogenase subunit beta (sulfur reductase)
VETATGNRRTMLRWTPDKLQALIEHLATDGYRVLGPGVQDQAVVYGEIDSLPVGWGDTQEAGHYRLRSRDDQSRFGYNLGPSTWKQFLFPPEEAIFRVQDGEFVSAREASQKMAFIGVRGCELAAIAVQDRVFLGEVEDPGYAARRRNLLLVAVNCAQAAATCFCTSTGDGPRAGAGADLVLTELNPEDPHYFVEASSAAGEELLAVLGGDDAGASDALEVDALLAGTRDQIQRKLSMDGLADDLLGALEHPHWDEVAQRCLACGNCTQVCPTCFCNSTHEQVDPLSLDVNHLRRWDSCFTSGHSYTAGGVVHASVRSRYRQWLTHKLASWEQQFGTSGCTGCGRCISWCPVAIDLTVETARLREAP